MTIVDIYNMLNNKESSTEKNCSCWKPVEAEDFKDIPEFSVPQKRKVASTNKMLESTLIFVDLVKHKRLCNKVTIMLKKTKTITLTFMGITSRMS